MAYLSKRRKQWTAGISNFEGVVPMPLEVVTVKEMLMDGSWKENTLQPELMCPITLSLGILSGNILLPGQSRATLASVGYILPMHDTEIVYH